MRFGWIIVLVLVELFCWWFTLTDIYQGIKKHTRPLRFSFYWIIGHVFALTLYSFAIWILSRG